MITSKEAPDNVIHIRQAWIRAIDRVAESIAYRFRQDSHDQYTEKSGQQTVIESVIALKALLVDYGEAPIKTEVKEWHNKHYDEMKNADSFKLHTVFIKEFDFIVSTLNKYNMLFDSQSKGYSNVTMKSV